MIISVFIFYGCNSKDQVNGKWDYPSGVMYNGNIYGVAENVFNKNLLGKELGVITSVIDGSEGMPKEEFQTNCYKVDQVIYSYGKDELYIVVLFMLI